MVNGLHFPRHEHLFVPGYRRKPDEDENAGPEADSDPDGDDEAENNVLHRFHRRLHFLRKLPAFLFLQRGR